LIRQSGRDSAGRAPSQAAVAFSSAVCDKPRLVEPPGREGCRGGSFCSSASFRVGAGLSPQARRVQESQMPKLKTKSGAKKRFKITGTGKVLYAQSGKRHGMIKRTNKQIRNLRGTAVLFEGDAVRVKTYFLPNG
jgi:large subunit ribosomal protein L35